MSCVSFLCYVLSFVIRHYYPKSNSIHSLRTIAISSIWFTISVSFTIYNKLLMNTWFDGVFKFALINTGVHMIVKFLISRLYQCIYKLEISDIPKDSMFINTTLLLMGIGLTTAGDVALSNESVMDLPIALYTTIKASSLIFTYIFGICLRIETFSFSTTVIIILISGGIMLAVAESSSLNSWIGVVFGVAASAMGGVRWVLLQMLLFSDMKSDTNPVFISIYRFSPYTLLFVPVAIMLEGTTLYQTFKDQNFTVILEIGSLSLIGGVISFCLIAVELELVKLTSSLTLAVLGQIKEVVQILLSLLIFKDTITIQSGIGIGIAIVVC